MKRNIEMSKIKVVRFWLRGWWRPTFLEGNEMKGKERMKVKEKKNEKIKKKGRKRENR